MHGGGPPVTAGRPLAAAYRNEAVDLVQAGCCNLARHVRACAAYGVPVVVALNRFAADTAAELQAVQDAALAAGTINDPAPPQRARALPWQPRAA